MTQGRITVLVENTAGGQALLGEHGLAYWIEVGEKPVLFDTGQGHVLLNNIRALGIHPERADAILLSHGHYDHTGGLSDALRATRTEKIYAHPAAFEPKYARNADGTSRDVGMPRWSVQAVNDLAERIPVEAPTAIGGGLHLTGPVPRVTDFEDTGGDFYKDAACTEPDDLPDDQSAFIDTPDGVIVILGCAHAGVINTLRYVRTVTDGRPIHTVVGGMHLLNAGPRRMEETIAALRELDVHRLMPCHCTGFAATAQLYNAFPDRYSVCKVGTRIVLNG